MASLREATERMLPQRLDRPVRKSCLLSSHLKLRIIHQPLTLSINLSCFPVNLGDQVAADLMTDECQGRESQSRLKMVRRQVRVAHGHGDRGVPEDPLQAQDVPSAHHVVTGEGVPQDWGRAFEASAI